MSYLPVFIFHIIIFVIAISSLKNSNLVLQSSESAFAIIQIWQQGSWRFFLPSVFSLPHIPCLQLSIFLLLFTTQNAADRVICYYVCIFNFTPSVSFLLFFLFLILFFNRFLDVFYVIPRRALQTEIDMLVLSDALTLVFFSGVIPLIIRLDYCNFFLPHSQSVSLFLALIDASRVGR